MKKLDKYYIIFNPDNQKYFSNRYWDNPYTKDIEDAYRFNTENEVLEFMLNDERTYNLFNDNQLFEIKTILY